jgi:Transposase DDE domain group 1
MATDVTLVMQRVVGIALGYEDLIDHDELRHDPVMAVLAGKLTARRSDCAPLEGRSTLSRPELSRPEPTLAVIMDVEATTAMRQVDVTAQHRMIERMQERFGLWPERLA